MVVCWLADIVDVGRGRTRQDWTRRGASRWAMAGGFLLGQDGGGFHCPLAAYMAGFGVYSCGFAKNDTPVRCTAVNAGYVYE